MRFRTFLLALLSALGLGMVPAASAAPTHGHANGRLGGVVVAQGEPQLGAIVVVTPAIGPGDPLRLVTDSHGVFASAPLADGFYSIRVRVAGFLPAFEPHVHVTGGHVTLLRVELGSIFSSIDRLRRGPHSGTSPDQWKWVLRSASITRPVLRFSEGHIYVSDRAERNAHAAHGRAEFTAGSLSSWSPVNTLQFGDTSFLYNQGLGSTSRLLLAGRVGYQNSASAGFAATWLHSPGVRGHATDSTTVIFHQAQMGPGGPAFRGMEIDSTHRLHVGNRLKVDYGGQYVFAMLNGSVSELRPTASVHIVLSSAWTASFLLGSDPRKHRAHDPVDALDGFPVPVESNGRLALDQAWHEEISIEHTLSSDASLSATAFHDSSAHVAIFGRGTLQGANTLSDPFSDAFVYNGGPLSQWGERLAYKRKLSPHWQATLVYTSATALAPIASGFARATLRDMIASHRRNLLGGRIAGRIQRLGTQFSAGYEWVDGPVLNRPDPFGDAALGVEPYLNVSLRQPLPSLFCCRIVALIDVRNMLAQGYVSLETPDGRAILIPAGRAIRGGFAVQF